MFYAATASATAFTFGVAGGSGAGGAIVVGDNIVLSLTIDSEVGDELIGWFVRVDHTNPASAASAVPGGIFLPNAYMSNFFSPVLNSDPAGTEQWGYGTAPGPFWDDNNEAMFGTISFTNLQAGTIEFDIAIQGGGVGGNGGVDLVAEGRVTFESITLPEPGLATMGFFTLVTLGVVRRSQRRGSSSKTKASS
jgi:hypothetical protein